MGSAARQLVDYLRTVPGFEVPTRGGGWGGHMGGVVCDAALQANRDYSSTVEPRIAAFVAEHPECVTIGNFLDRVAGPDPVATLALMLDWNGIDRPRRAIDMAEKLRAMGVDTATELFTLAQFDRPAILAALRTVRGVGPKTSSYLLGLTGDPAAVAVDVRLRDVVRSAGIKLASDVEVAAVITEAAGLLNVTPWALDGAIWNAKQC